MDILYNSFSLLKLGHTIRGLRIIAINLLIINRKALATIASNTMLVACIYPIKTRASSVKIYTHPSIIMGLRLSLTIRRFSSDSLGTRLTTG